MTAYSRGTRWTWSTSTRSRLSGSCEMQTARVPSCRNLSAAFRNSFRAAARTASACRSSTSESPGERTCTHESTRCWCHCDSFCFDALALLAFLSLSAWLRNQFAVTRHLSQSANTSDLNARDVELILDNNSDHFISWGHFPAFAFMWSHRKLFMAQSRVSCLRNGLSSTLHTSRAKEKEAAKVKRAVQKGKRSEMKHTGACDT